MPRGSLQEIKDLFESLQIKLDLPVNEKNVKKKNMKQPLINYTIN